MLSPPTDNISGVKASYEEGANELPPLAMTPNNYFKKDDYGPVDKR